MCYVGPMLAQAPHPHSIVPLCRGNCRPARKTVRSVTPRGARRYDRLPAPVAAGPMPDQAQPPAGSLLQRIASGDRTAVQKCIDQYAGLVWSLTRRLTMNTAEAEDAVQEIFVELWRNAYRFDPEIASETAFVAMIARRRLIDRRRRLGRQRDRTQLDEATHTRPAGEPFEGGEEAAVAARAMQELSAEQQRVLRLSIFHGLSHEKIATATGLPLGTVKTHARRGLLRIRELLSGVPGTKGVNS